MPTMTDLLADLRRTFGHPPVDPFDASAPPGTIRRRVAAHNALMDVARPGRDRICGNINTPQGAPCVLREGHTPPRYDPHWPDHMDVEQRDRARRYLVHSDADPARRA